MTHATKASNPVIVGATYTEKATGKEFVLAGLRSNYRVSLIRHPDVREDGPTIERLDPVTVSDLETNFEYTRCDHESFYCRLHEHHNMLHRGCMLR